MLTRSCIPVLVLFSDAAVVAVKRLEFLSSPGSRVESPSHWIPDRRCSRSHCPRDDQIRDSHGMREQGSLMLIDAVNDH
jgi:hypothetical protein